MTAMKTKSLRSGLFLLFLLGLGIVGARAQDVDAQEPSTQSMEPEGAESISEDGEIETLDEFESLSDWEEIEDSENAAVEEHSIPRGLKFAVLGLLFTVIAGVLVRFKPFRTTRTILLLSSLAVFGFWNGGCPCPISSIQNLVLWAMNVDVKLHSLLWFVGLIPITYFLGRVWCGWICHLGAFQEFVHKPNRFSFLRGERAQKTMRVTRYVLFGALLVQLVLTKDNQFVHIDPFKVAFNLRSFYLTGWILLGVLMVSSLYIYRPFCRSVCPVGLVLGWVSRLPLASKLGLNEDCRTCNLCTKACPSQAIRVVDKQVEVRQEDCLACGSCMDACRRDYISFYRKVEDDVRTISLHHVGDRSRPFTVDKSNGRPNLRNPGSVPPQAGEGRLGSVVGRGVDRTDRLSD